MPSIKFWGILAAVLFCLAAGAGVAHLLDANHYGKIIADGKTDLANEKTSHAEDLREVSNTAALAASNALTYQQDLQNQIAASDAAHTEELKDAHDQTSKLAAAVDSGAQRLRIAVAAQANHPAGGNGVPATTSTAGMVDATVDLAPEARQAYFDLRSSIQSDQVVIEGLQDFARTCTSARP